MATAPRSSPPPPPDASVQWMKLHQVALVYPLSLWVHTLGVGWLWEISPWRKIVVLGVGIKLTTFQSEVAHSSHWAVGGLVTNGY